MSESLHVVAIGGGGGATQVLKAAQSFTDQLTAVIAVTDTGRSTGLARTIGGIPAPGDLRATIAAFATDQQMAPALDALGDDFDELIAIITPWGRAVVAAHGYLGGVSDLTGA